MTKGRTVRRDSYVVTLAREIELEFGLPAGSVWLLNPNGSKAPGPMLIGELLDEFNCWDRDLLASVRAMILKIEGNPCVNVNAQDKSVFVCRRIFDLQVTEHSVEGMCDWVDPQDARPDELSDGLAISCDCLEIGLDWWLDTYFQSYLVFDAALVARSLNGDHSWVNTFLEELRQSDA